MVSPDDEQRLRKLVAADLSVRAIAEELSVAPVTVRRRLERLGLRTTASRAADAARARRVAGVRETARACRVHGETLHVIDRAGVFRCRRCRADAVARRRRAVRCASVCVLCGYSRHAAALHSHHVDPAQKAFTIRDGDTRGIDVMRAEVRKCVLLCANCHAEVEVGEAALPHSRTMHARSGGAAPSISDPG